MATATTISPRFELTVVFGSVIMKKTKSWYIGPVIGAISVTKDAPVNCVRTNEKTRKAAT
jgi:hypothetical protein